MTNTSPSSATTAVGASTIKSALITQQAEKLVIDAALTGGTGGTLDVYLQRKIASDTWRDFVHFPQLAAGASKNYTVTITGEGTSIAESFGGSDASPGVGLAANAVINVIPAGEIRMVFVSGSGTSAGAANTVVITPFTERN